MVVNRFKSHWTRNDLHVVGAVFGYIDLIKATDTCGEQYVMPTKKPFDLHAHGVRTAVVTSSNQPKMESVYRAQPGFKQLFDAILTSEDFEYSKPHPDCYLKAAARFGVQPSECVVFEDSFNGLKSGRAAGMKVVGVATTNPQETIAPLSDIQITDYVRVDYQSLLKLF